MHSDYSKKGFEVLAYPCNQYGSQEPGNAEEIQKTLDQFAVKFPVMEKVDVTGEKIDPLFQWLRDEPNLNFGEIQWNFEKYLIDDEGEI